MAKFGFLSVLDDELNNNFSYDYEINWDKKNHAVELFFLLDAKNAAGISILDEAGTESAEDIVYEDAIIFYNPSKSKVKESEYLISLPYSDKGLSAEFISFFVEYLQGIADDGLDALMDFLADDTAQEFSLSFDEASFNEGVSKLDEVDFHKYPRY